MGGGWGMPFGMFLCFIFFLICFGVMFCCLIRGKVPFACCGRHGGNDDRELLEEVRKLRMEIEELKNKDADRK
jgi:hypothetical protein